LTQEYGSLLIFDEVMTGYRVDHGGAQSLFGVLPDITCLGKIIGGGMPVGAYGGKREIMDYVAPRGQVYQAGTLSGNPLAMAADIATLTQLGEPGFFDTMNEKANRLAIGFRRAAENAGIDVTVDRVGSMLGLFFTRQRVLNFDDAKSCNLDMFSAFYRGMLEEGIYLAPSQFEALFVSSAHDTEHIDETISAAEKVMDRL
jgi:glutamate-1-semialdehyde 2,1-aminomutase